MAHSSMLHGGEIYGDAKITHDFSVNINPLGAPQNVIERLHESLASIEQYPDRLCMELRAALENAYGVDRDRILCGSGASELIQLAVAAVRPKQVLLLAPSFLGYEKAAKAFGADIEWYFLEREENLLLSNRYLAFLDKISPDLVILCSPSNPAGSRIETELILEIADVCEKKKIALMMDECFNGLTIEDSDESIRYLVNSNRYLMIADAFTKRFAIPGLRLGYLFSSNEEWMEKMREIQTEWSVSSLAQIAGVEALKTPDIYLKKSRELIKRERGYLVNELKKMNFRVYPGIANFILFETEKEIFQPLFAEGILIRHCGNYMGLDDNFYRVAVKPHEENVVLTEALKRICEAE